MLGVALGIESNGKSAIVCLMATHLMRKARSRYENNPRGYYWSEIVKARILGLHVLTKGATLS